VYASSRRGCKHPQEEHPGVLLIRVPKHDRRASGVEISPSRIVVHLLVLSLSLLETSRSLLEQRRRKALSTGNGVLPKRGPASRSERGQCNRVVAHVQAKKEREEGGGKVGTAGFEPA
jgi:hypothetical protein